MDSNGLFKLTVQILLVLVIASCATVTAEERATVARVGSSNATGAGSEAINSADKNIPTRVILYRKWNGEGLAEMASGPKVEIDGRQVGRCFLGEGKEIELEPGEHQIIAPFSKTSARRFFIEKGQTVYIECRYIQGVLGANVEFIFRESRG